MSMTTSGTGTVTVCLEQGSPRHDTDAGGKGASLDRLVQLGFPIPPTAVVAVAAYRAIAAHPDLAELLSSVADGGAAVPAEVIDAAFLSVPIPEAIRRSIVEAACRVGGGGPVAVRSSATVEDMAAASFAGQYRSSLDVQGDDAVLRAVRLTWASLWHPAPCAYRRLHGIAGDGIGMAVVLLRMVPARTAGVVFTVDPGGAGDQVRVEAVTGLGVSLVSGARTPECGWFPGSRSTATGGRRPRSSGRPTWHFRSNGPAGSRRTSSGHGTVSDCGWCRRGRSPPRPSTVSMPARRRSTAAS